jgi:hypothetical protein
MDRFKLFRQYASGLDRSQPQTCGQIGNSSRRAYHGRQHRENAIDAELIGVLEMEAMPDLCYMRQPVHGQALRLIDDLMIGRCEIARLPMAVEISYSGSEALQEAGMVEQIVDTSPPRGRVEIQVGVERRRR